MKNTMKGLGLVALLGCEPRSGGTTVITQDESNPKFEITTEDGTILESKYLHSSHQEESWRADGENSIAISADFAENELYETDYLANAAYIEGDTLIIPSNPDLGEDVSGTRQLLPGQLATESNMPYLFDEPNSGDDYCPEDDSTLMADYINNLIQKGELILVRATEDSGDDFHTVFNPGDEPWEGFDSYRASGNDPLAPCWGYD